MSRTRKQKKTGGKAVDNTCGNNKGCPVCEGNRLHKHKKKSPLKEIQEEGTQWKKKKMYVILS